MTRTPAQPRRSGGARVAVQRRMATLLLALLLAACRPHPAPGQGLVHDPNAGVGATAAQARLAELYAKATKWRADFKAAPAAACNGARGTICGGAGTGAVAETAQLLLATSPPAFDARSPGQMGGFSAVGAVKDQGDCNSCVAFALLAAAASAVACGGTQADASSSSLSEQDFFFCRATAAGEERNCGSSWSLSAGVTSLIRLAAAGQLPVVERCMPYDPGATGEVACRYECSAVDPTVKGGTFKYVQLDEPWMVQQHIRLWGSALTALDVYSDFKPFFADNPNGAYPGPGPKATYQLSHAIQLIGYDNKGGWWLAKNSWGPDFASSGFFRIKYGACGVAAPGSTYGIKWEPAGGLPRPTQRLSPSRARQGCYDYSARPSDYASKVAYVWGLPLQQVVLDNREVLGTLGPDVFLGGTTLVLCGLQLRQGEAPGRAGGSGGSGGGGGGAAAAENKPQPQQLSQPQPQPQAQAQLQPQPQTQQPQPQPQAQAQPQRAAPAARRSQGTYVETADCPSIPGTNSIRMSYTLEGGRMAVSSATHFSYLWINCDEEATFECREATDAEKARAVAGDAYWAFDPCPSGVATWFCDHVRIAKSMDGCGGTKVEPYELAQFCGTPGEQMFAAWTIKDGNGRCTVRFNHLTRKRLLGQRPLLAGRR